MKKLLIIGASILQLPAIQRAKELGMADTNFVNCTGLPDPDHVTSAYDIALMSRALLSHDKIKDYSSMHGFGNHHIGHVASVI